jgi:hypothetical protein
MRIIHSAIVIAAVAATSGINAQYSHCTVKIGILTDILNKPLGVRSYGRH